ncbi:hypothetical protein [Pseudescherichia sp.]|uniref:hypothetical protein n=1 Tax=Pseudescherichia sp. TaxID=2055881 RepID=UPI002896FBE2|nr:hypothetical protein [Pseudescherichia sp.]
MKLIEILVRDLPAFGGWPEGAVECHRFVDEANIDFYDEHGNWDADCGLEYGMNFAEEAVRERAAGDPMRTESVTRDEYEAALAASKEMLVNKPVWDGQGLPPMDMECEAVFSDGSEVLVGKAAYIGEHTIFITRKTNNQHHPEVESVLRTGNWSFRPHINEAGRKREEIIDALHKSLPDITYTDCIDVYNLILSGDIPGVKLEDPDA